MQRLTIKLESYMDEEEGSIVETSYTQEDIKADDLFWLWFISAFDTLGFPSISEELRKDV